MNNIFRLFKNSQNKNQSVLVNNDIYDLHVDNWYGPDNTPFAILRRESTLKNKYIQDNIQKEFGDKKLKILDLGCGGGLISNYLASCGHEVHAVDISLPSLKVAEQYDQTKSVNYIQSCAYNTPFENLSFDIVLAMDMLEHVEEPEKVTKEASRLLKKGGLYFYHTFNKNIFSYLVAIKFIDWFCPNTHKNMHIYRLFIKPKTLLEQCNKYGLKNNETIGSTVCFFTWGFLKSLVTQRIDKEFRFKTCQSTLIGYLGYATKNSNTK